MSCLNDTKKQKKTEQRVGSKDVALSQFLREIFLK